MFKAGMRVKVKRGLVTLTYGWGKVGAKEVGVVIENPGNGDIYLDFPQHRNFVIREEELDHLKRDTEESRAERKLLADQIRAERAVRRAFLQSLSKEEVEASKKFIKAWSNSSLKIRGYGDLHYKGTGHAGYKSFTGKWYTKSSCYSSVCRDGCNIIIKSTKPNVFTKEQRRFIDSLIKGVNGRVRDYMRRKPLDWEENTAWFGCGRGYSNYFAFCLWRMIYNKPRLVLFFQYLRKCGYNTSQSYYLLSLFKTAFSVGDLNIIGGRLSKGVITRLTNSGRKKNVFPYSMSSYITPLGNDYVKTQPQKLTVECLCKTNLDKLLQEV